MVGVDRSAVAQWETNQSNPRMGNIQKLAAAFNIPVSSLLDPELTTDGHVRPIVGIRPLGRVHAGPFSDEEEGITDVIEVPSSLLERHPRAQAVLVEGDCMDRVIPEGMAVIIDHDIELANGKVVVVETEDHRALIRRIYRGGKTLMLVADSHADYDDIVVDLGSPICLIGTVVWVQSPGEFDE